MTSPSKKTRRHGTFDCLESRVVLSLVLSPVNIAAPVQSEFSGVVATLIDTNFNDTPSDFNKSPGSVQIDWGDNQTSSGLVVGALLPGVFAVDASHVYASAGSYSTRITVTAQNGQDAIANGVATVTTEPPQLTIVGNAFGGTAGTPIQNVTVATFLDTNPTDTLSDFNALITWGDGQASIGTVAGSNGTFTVTGGHTYASPGNYVTNVTVIGLNNGPSAFTSGQANIAPAPRYAITGQQFIETAGSSFTVSVATFTDMNTSDPSSLFSASINWGNGLTTRGSVTGGNGSFTITGSNIYTFPGTYKVITTLVDMSNNSAMATSTAVVSGPVLTAVPITITPSIGVPFTGIVASFFDTNTSDSIGNLSATINWGDGNFTTGTVLPALGTPNLFNVLGTNTYASAGVFPISVMLVNRNGQSATAESAAIIPTPPPPAPPAPSIVATGTSFPIIPGQPLANIVVATFTDTNPAVVANTALISAVINWGNGDTTQGNVMPVMSNGAIVSFNVLSGSYAFPTPGPAGTIPVTVTITDTSGLSATANSTAIVVNTISNASANPFQFTGGLALIGSNGPHAQDGYTITNQPTFSGTASPFSIVQLYARPFGIDTQLPLGTAVTNGAGQWSLTAGPLLPGRYNISAIVTPSGGYPSAMMSLKDDGLVHIDMVPKRSHPHGAAAVHKTAKHPRPTHHQRALARHHKI